MRSPRTRRPTRRLALAPLALALATGGLAVAAPAPDRTAVPTLETASPRVPQGGTLELHGRGFAPGVHVALLIERPDGEAKRVGGARTGRRGGFVADVRIRRHVAPGRYVARACRDGCRIEASARFRVVRP